MLAHLTLLNVKETLSKRRNNMQWFRVPQKIFFENSITYLRHIDAERDVGLWPGMVQFGYADLLTPIGTQPSQTNHEVFSQMLSLTPSTNPAVL